jgi:hypothetical protein
LHSVFDSWTVHRTESGRAHTIQRSLALLILKTVLWRQLDFTLYKIEYPGWNACRLIRAGRAFGNAATSLDVN